MPAFTVIDFLIGFFPDERHAAHADGHSQCQVPEPVRFLRLVRTTGTRCSMW